MDNQENQDINIISNSDSNIKNDKNESKLHYQLINLQPFLAENSKPKESKKGRKARRKKDDDGDSDESFKVDVEEERMFKMTTGKKVISLNPDEPVKERPKPVIDRTLQVDHVINLDELNLKEKITNFNMLLAIIEITKNTKYYGMSNSTKSRNFWEILERVEDFENVFGAFKSETLRKYWRLLSTVADMDKLLELIKENQTLIDNPILK